MPCSHRTARCFLSLQEDIARSAMDRDFRQTFKLGGHEITIHTGAAGELQPVYTKKIGDDPNAFVSKRFVLQLIETFKSESR